MIRLTTVGIVLAFLMSALAAAQSQFEHVDVFRSGEDGYHTYRIPTIEAAADGTLIALAEGRKYNSADPGLPLDARQVKGPHRWQALSRDGGETWADHRPGVEVTPVCCAIERWTIPTDQEESDCILWTGPKGPGRNNLVARVSRDQGKTFPAEHLIAEAPAAYSDLTLLDDGSAGVLWERGGYKQITFTRLSRDLVQRTDQDRQRD